MKDIVSIEKNNELRVQVLDIAKFSQNTLNSVQGLIRNHSKSLKEFGNLKSAEQGVFKLSESLNEEQSYFLLTLMKNSPKVLLFKKNLIKQFFKYREQICETNKLQLESKDKQLKISQQQTEDAKREVYAHPRNGNVETVTRIIKDSSVEMSANDLNMLLVGEGMLKATPKKGFDFCSEIMSGNTPLLHVDTVLKIIDKNGIKRGRGYHDTHQAFKL